MAPMWVVVGGGVHVLDGVEEGEEEAVCDLRVGLAALPSVERGRGGAE